jgi:hypothetical protein
MYDPEEEKDVKKFGCFLFTVRSRMEEAEKAPLGVSKMPHSLLGHTEKGEEVKENSDQLVMSAASRVLPWLLGFSGWILDRFVLAVGHCGCNDIVELRTTKEQLVIDYLRWKVEKEKSNEKKGICSNMPGRWDRHDHSKRENDYHDS